MRDAVNDTIAPVDPDISPETRLWKAVPSRLVEDAVTPGSSRGRAEARQWLIGEDFHAVADMAGYDGEALREALEPRIAEWAAEASPPPPLVVKCGRGRPRKVQR